MWSPWDARERSDVTPGRLTVVMADADRRVIRTAAAQLGLVTMRQALTAGLTMAQVKHRISSGQWMRVSRGVYLLAATPASFEQAVMSVLLAAGPFAVASHRTAAQLWGFRDIRSEVIAITVPSGAVGRLAGVTYHRTDTLPVDHWTRRPDGIRLTSPARTLLDLGADATEFEVERAVNDAVFRKLTDRPSLVAILDEIGGHGRRGTAHLRAALDRGVLGSAPVESELELRFLRDVVRGPGLPVPEPQFRIGRMRVDFAYPVQRIAVELDGARWHTDSADRARDQARDAALVRAGWRIIRYRWADVTRHPDRVAAELRRHLARSLVP